ncbi:hypothetical protein [Devosia soli]|uniref:hypothetical protein n=1 Tax=Devosia soli TaxID=361041 RepID=UPI000B113A51|nr:hypothetical protein [Devosia soli]
MMMMTRRARQRRMKLAQMALVAGLATIIFLPRLEMPNFDGLQLPMVSTVNAAEAGAE